MVKSQDRQKVVVIGAGPVGALAALYAARRGDEVEVYELRDGMYGYTPGSLHHHLPHTDSPPIFM